MKGLTDEMYMAFVFCFFSRILTIAFSRTKNQLINRKSTVSSFALHDYAEIGTGIDGHLSGEPFWPGRI